MRRIYESEALHRDDDEPQAPRERRRRSYTPRAVTSVDAGALADWLVPQWLGRRVVGVDVRAPEEPVVVGEPVAFEVELRNRAPFPVTLETDSPVTWTWTLDGRVEASEVPQCDPPARGGELSFGRGERKRFRRRWSGLVRVSEHEWELPEPGEHALGAAIDVADPGAAGLAATTTIELVEE